MDTNNEIILTTEEQQIINADLAHNFNIIPKEDKGKIVSFFIDETKFNDSIKQELELIIGKGIELHPVSTDMVNKALIS